MRAEKSLYIVFHIHAQGKVLISLIFSVGYESRP